MESRKTVQFSFALMSSALSVEQLIWSITSTNTSVTLQCSTGHPKEEGRRYRGERGCPHPQVTGHSNRSNSFPGARQSAKGTSAQRQLSSNPKSKANNFRLASCRLRKIPRNRQIQTCFVQKTMRTALASVRQWSALHLKPTQVPQLQQNRSW